MLYDAGLDIVEVRNHDNDTRKRYLVYVTVPSSSRKPCFDLIIVRNTSRFARNINATQILEQLKQLKVYVYFCDIDKTTEKESDMEEIQSHILAAERESRMKSRVVIFGTKESANLGVIKANDNIYGYKFIKGLEYAIDTRLEVIESEAEVIRKMYNWYIQGYGLRRLRNLLTDRGIFNRNGKAFSKSTIKRILTNEKYKGWNVRNKYDTGTVFNKNTYAQVRDKSEWIVHKDTDKIPAIVSEEVFDKVQELLEGKSEHKANVGKYNGISEFAGRIICAKCGCVYYANTDKGRKFYNCSTKKKYGIKKCDNRNISLNQINERISLENYRRDICEANIFCRQILIILTHKLVHSMDGNASDRVKTLEKELKSLEERKKRIVEIYINGNIDEKDYLERFTPVNEKIQQLNLEVTQLSKNNKTIIEDIIEISDGVEELMGDFKIYTNYSKKFEKEHTREDIVRDIQKIIVQEDGTMDIEYTNFKKYCKIIERYRKLLNAFIPDGDYDKAKKEIRERLQSIQVETKNKLKNKELCK